MQVALGAVQVQLARMIAELPAADTTAPTVTLIVSSNNLTVAGNLTLTASAKDGTGVVRIEFYRGSTLLGEDVSAPYTLTESVSYSGNGTYLYKTRAYDAAGNWTDSAAQSVTINIPAPPAAPTLALDRTTASTGATVTATLSQLQPGDQLDWGDGTVVPADDNSLSHSYTASGPYTVRVLRGGVSRASVTVTISTPIIGITYDPPKVITQGGTYRGNWQSVDNPDIPAVDIQTNQPVIVEMSNVRGRGDLIRCRQGAGNVTLRNITGAGLNSGVRGRHQGRFADLQFLRAALVEHCDITGTTGIYLNEKDQASGTFIVQFNFGHDINGQYSDGNGGYMTGVNDFFRGQIVQFNNMRNLSGSRIAWNRTRNIARQSHIEDTVNLSNCEGASDADRIIVERNMFDGAFAWNPEAAYSGSAIALCDGNGKNQTARFNVVLECSNAGIFISDGENASIEDNIILGTGKLADGTFLDADSDAGIYLRDYSPVDSPRPYQTVIAERNTVGWGTPTPDNPNGRWDFSLQVINGQPQGIERNNTFLPPGPITEATLENARQTWLGWVASAGHTIGRTA